MNKYLKISNIFAYLQGYWRYHFYYSTYFKWMIRQHIFEQIQYRISKMDIKCFEDGSCKMCGCDTTALQMADKACDKPCYPKMMNRRNWNGFKKVMNIEVKDVIIVKRDIYNTGLYAPDILNAPKMKYVAPTVGEMYYIIGVDPYKKEEDGETLERS